MAGIRFKKSEEPSTPTSSRVEFWFDAINDVFKYKQETGESFSLVSSKELEELRNTVITPITWKKESYVLTETDISNGFVILQFKAKTNSINAAIDRLVIHEGTDYLVENTTDNKSKVTFTGSLASGQPEEIAAGLVFSVSYAVQ